MFLSCLVFGKVNRLINLKFASDDARPRHAHVDVSLLLC